MGWKIREVGNITKFGVLSVADALTFRSWLGFRVLYKAVVLREPLNYVYFCIISVDLCCGLLFMMSAQGCLLYIFLVNLWERQGGSREDAIGARHQRLVCNSLWIIHMIYWECLGVYVDFHLLSVKWGPTKLFSRPLWSWLKNSGTVYTVNQCVPNELVCSSFPSPFAILKEIPFWILSLPF